MNRNRMMALLLALCVLAASVTIAGAEPLELNEQLSDDALQIEMPEDDENLGIELDDAGEDFDDSTLEIDGLTLIDDPDVEALDQENLGIELPGEELELTGEDAAAQVEANAEEDVPIDEAHFPDETFRAYILEKIDGNEDGVLSIEERDRVTEIKIQYEGSKNLVGIKLFTNLEYLDCSYNQLTSLDVSGCTSLANLYCDNNQLTSLDVSGCTSLVSLYSNNNQLTSLDVSGCTSLASLHSNNNQLTSLDVSGLTNLKYVDCYENMLKNVNVNGCTGLEKLYCYTNQMTSLDVNGCVNLTNLFCYENELTHLNLYGCSQLSELACFHNHMTSLDISDCPILVSDVTKGRYETGISLDNVDYTYAGYYYRTRYDHYSGTRYLYAYFRFDKGLTIFTTSPSAQLKENEITMGIGEEISILSADSPVPASDCSFGSYNPDVAEVDGNGVITGRRVGKTTITVTTNRGVKATCKVHVKKAPTSIELSKSKLELGKGEAYQLTAKLSKGSAGRITWSCNKKKVSLVADADVLNTSVCSVVGKNTTVTKVVVTARTYNGLEATCTVAVYRAPTAVWLSHEKLTMGVGEPFTLKAENIVGYSNLAWSSSKPKIVSVDANGKIKALKKGTAKITVKTFNGKKATCEVTVKAKPTSIKLDKKTLNMRPYDTYVLTPTLSKNSGAIIKWKSSNKSVATVDENGMVTSLKEGSTTITAYTWNKKKVTCKVKVARNSNVKYRALLIGQEKTYKNGDVPNFRKDVYAMSGMLMSVKGPSGGKWNITEKYDVGSSKEVLALVKDTFSGATSNDVSLFFISCHAGPFVTGGGSGNFHITDTPKDDYLQPQDLADTLAKIPGKIVLILANCGSGIGIYSNLNGTAQKNAAYIGQCAQAFNEAVIDAFASADSGLYVDAQGDIMEAGELHSNGNLGALKKVNKFFVLTSCGYGEEAYFVTYQKRSKNGPTFFVSALVKGVGSLNSPADVDMDNIITLQELYDYTYRITLKKANEANHEQHVQVYPSNCGFGLFSRRYS